MILLDILGLFQLIQVTYFLDDTIIYQYCSSHFLFHLFKKRKVQFHLGGNEVENYYIPANIISLIYYSHHIFHNIQIKSCSPIII